VPHGARLRLTLLAAAVGCIVTACLPIPHAHRRSPAIQGHVLDDGQPVGGLTVKRVLGYRAEDCVLEGDVVVTDDNGSFTFERRYEFAAVVPLYGDPVDPMVLCVYRGAELVATAEFTLMGGAPKEITVTCDVRRSGVCRPPPTPRPTPGPFGPERLRP
jgi:hypothetical protein